MTHKLVNSIKSKTVKKRRNLKKPNNIKPSIEQDIQQQRCSEIELTQTSIQLQHDDKQTIPIGIENSEYSASYHPWKWEYHTIITREKSIKPMTKDSYTPTAPLVSHAVQGVSSKDECSCILAPAKAVKIQTLNIQRSSKLSLPFIIRYVRSNELMPSERSTSKKTALLPQIQIKKSTISPRNTSIPLIAPKTDRLLNETTLLNNISAIEQLSKRLVSNIFWESLISLTICD
ncbi:unnamed protein product [Adineta steineri]|uniref:Uncharacterized protein n=1 Tax=Adineta steineri TaxID=433720 RepID=A0A813N8D2_9BILA|nr:unnamed protein product [Adineta steineri]